jgi:hypothetical protein
VEVAFLFFMKGMGFGIWKKIKEGYNFIKDKVIAGYHKVRDFVGSIGRKVGNTGGPFGDISEKIGDGGAFIDRTIRKGKREWGKLFK